MSLHVGPGYQTRGGRPAQIASWGLDIAGRPVWHGWITGSGSHAWYADGRSPIGQTYDLISKTVTLRQEQRAMSDEPQIGEIVHASFENEHKQHVCRPAIVVRRWSAEPGTPLQLQVFTDGGNDGPMFATGLYWMTSVKHRPVGEHGYHFAHECDGRL